MLVVRRCPDLLQLGCCFDGSGPIYYPVYLEIDTAGTCMAHVPSLPGCIVRAPTRDEALRRLPDAIREYHAWLRRHGEPVPSDEEPIEIEVVGESSGFGPFDPGDAAALFPPDREPVTPEEMEHHFRLMAYARADLLDRVRHLPDDLLDWQPEPESFSIRRLLRHIGNAEEWYVSRIVSPETLPPEWEQDEELPIFEFLEMERRTAVARLRQLTEEQRSGVFYPTQWTEHPDEPWTARKVLRRFLEHEWEHTAQVREFLAGWRTQLLGHLTAERITLLEQIAGLDAKTLSESPVLDDWTVKDLLAAEMDEAWQTLRGRLDGLTDEEFFWEPVPSCWTVHPAESGRWVADYADPAPEPPPFTTIGWRLVHVAACKIMYHEYAFGPGRLTWDELQIPHTAAGAIGWLEEGHRRLRTALDDLTDADLEEMRLTNWGERWPTWRIFWTWIFHDLHHGAEIGCLRDLYRAKRS